MNREYYQRGQRKTLEEIENVVSVKAPATPTVRSELGDELRADDVGMPEDTFEAFQNANWVFVQPTPDTTRRLDARDMGELAEDAGKLVKKDNGRFGIVSARLNVQLTDDVPEDQAESVLNELGLQVVGQLTFADKLYEVDTTAHADALEASLALHDDPRVKMAEPSFEEHIPGRFTPTDPRYAEQWQWSNTGQAGGTAGADVSAEDAWGRTRGAGVRVAVIDNGFLATHEDLQPGVVGVSGFFVNAAPRPTFTQGTGGMPGSNHGTFCAGMVGARQGNGLGVSGAAPESELMLVACLGDQVGTQTTLARAVAYTADPSREVAGADPNTGADILVSSLGPNGAAWDLTTTLQLALEFAAANGRGGRGMAIFWAASNGNNVDVLQDEVVSHADVIAVVRSNNMDLEDNAARGPEVELIAPGVNVVSTTGNGAYGTSTGTSFAAPAAAGCAALALSVNPGLTRDELRSIMRETADKIGGVTYDAVGHNDDYGFGRVNAAAAVDAAETAGAVAVKGKDIALVRQTPGWASIPVAFSRGDGNWDITNGAAPNFIPSWAPTPGVRVVTGDFNGNGLTDVALVRQQAGWASIPVAFARGDGNWDITNGAAPNFIPSWAPTPGVRVVTGDFNGNGLTDIALVRQQAGWASIPVAFSRGDGNWDITNGAAPTFIPSWAPTPGVKIVTGDFNGNGLTDIALVRQTPGWASIPIAFSRGDGNWDITNGAAPDFIASWAATPGARIVTGDFNGNGLTDIALVRQTPGWATIPIAFAQGDGTWQITNAPAPNFIPSWAATPGVKIVTGDFNGNGLTDIALVRQTPGWASIPIAFAQGDGTWQITNGAAPDFIPNWAPTPGVRIVTGDFNDNGLTDIALVRQMPGWGSIPVAFARGDGNWDITNGAAPNFIPNWAPTGGVKLVNGDYR